MAHLALIWPGHANPPPEHRPMRAPQPSDPEPPHPSQRLAYLKAFTPNLHPQPSPRTPPRPLRTDARRPHSIHPPHPSTPFADARLPESDGRRAHERAQPRRAVCAPRCGRRADGHAAYRLARRPGDSARPRVTLRDPMRPHATPCDLM
eukprot:6965172-Prymnesium_polylepis.2